MKLLKIFQINNLEEIKQNRRVEENAFAIRHSYRANGEKLERSDLEYFEKQVALKYSTENNIWFKDISSSSKLTPI